MWEKVLKLLDMGCWHRRLSMPFSPAPPRSYELSSQDAPSLPPYNGGTYVVCLDCGRHFVYDWSQMRVLK
jgi:hypothetical protein